MTEEALKMITEAHEAVFEGEKSGESMEEEGQTSGNNGLIQNAEVCGEQNSRKQAGKHMTDAGIINGEVHNKEDEETLA